MKLCYSTPVHQALFVKRIRSWCHSDEAVVHRSATTTNPATVPHRVADIEAHGRHWFMFACGPASPSSNRDPAVLLTLLILKSSPFFFNSEQQIIQFCTNQNIMWISYRSGDPEEFLHRWNWQLQPNDEKIG